MTANPSREVRPPLASPVPPTATGTGTSGRFRSLDDPESLREFARNLREGIYITSPEGTILDANPAFLEIIGVASLDELRALNARDLYVDPPRRDQEIALLERDGAVREFEIAIRRPDGNVRTLLDTAYAIADPATGERFYHGILVDITSRKQLEDELLELSIHDPLTGCLNRRILVDVEEALARIPDRPWGCVFVDIDHFKRYNDERGHQAGDDVLVRMARFLMWNVRTKEAVVRYGGDEFVILLNGADAAQTELVAGRLRGAAEESAPVPFSMGWAAREEGESLTHLIHRADEALLHVRVSDRGAGARRERDR